MYWMRIASIYKGKRIELTDEMYALLDYAVKYPTQNRWHDIGIGKALEAAQQLEEAGLIEIREFSNQFRLAP
jgi:hypothetical protein